MLIRYIRRGKNRKKGVLVAVPIDNKVKFGWSLCHRRDKFDKNLGKKIAIDRALCDRKIKMPQSIRNDMNMFVIRATRYYKDKEIVDNCYIEGVPIAEKYEAVKQAFDYAIVP